MPYEPDKYVVIHPELHINELGQCLIDGVHVFITEGWPTHCTEYSWSDTVNHSETEKYRRLAVYLCAHDPNVPDDDGFKYTYAFFTKNARDMMINAILTEVHLTMPCATTDIERIFNRFTEVEHPDSHDDYFYLLVTLLNHICDIPSVILSRYIDTMSDECTTLNVYVQYPKKYDPRDLPDLNLTSNTCYLKDLFSCAKYILKHHSHDLLCEDDLCQLAQKYLGVSSDEPITYIDISLDPRSITILDSFYSSMTNDERSEMDFIHTTERHFYRKRILYPELRECFERYKSMGRNIYPLEMSETGEVLIENSLECASISDDCFDETYQFSDASSGDDEDDRISRSEIDDMFDRNIVRTSRSVEPECHMKDIESEMKNLTSATEQEIVRVDCDRGSVLQSAFGFAVYYFILVNTCADHYLTQDKLYRSIVFDESDESDESDGLDGDMMEI
jgi:hypothetical protein